MLEVVVMVVKPTPVPTKLHGLSMITYPTVLLLLTFLVDQKLPGVVPVID